MVRRFNTGGEDMKTSARCVKQGHTYKKHDGKTAKASHYYRIEVCAVCGNERRVYTG